MDIIHKQNSKSAKKKSLTAIAIALISLLTTLLLSFFDKTQKVSVEKVPEHIEETIKQSLNSQLDIYKLLIDIKSKQDSVKNPIESNSELIN